MYEVPEITPFVKGFFENATSLCPKQLVQAMLLLSKAISAGHAAEETRKQAREILRFQPTADLDENFKRKLIMSNHNICNQSTRDLNFAIVHISEANAQLMEKFVMCALK